MLMNKLYAFLHLVALMITPMAGHAQAHPLIPTVEIPQGSFYMGSEGKGEDYDEAPVPLFLKASSAFVFPLFIMKTG